MGVDLHKKVGVGRIEPRRAERVWGSWGGNSESPTTR